MQVHTELPMFRRNVDSFPFRRISGTLAWPFFSKGDAEIFRRIHIIIYNELDAPIVNIRFSINHIIIYNELDAPIVNIRFSINYIIIYE